MEVNRKMTVAEVIQMDMKALDVLEKYNMTCATCNAVYNETLETAAIANDIDIENLVIDLRNVVKQKKAAL